MKGSIDRHRALSTFFQPPIFRKILHASETASLRRRIVKFKQAKRPLKIRSILSQFYQELENNYCNEYVFKNSLFNFEFLDSHCLLDTTVLDEFRIGTSVADFVLLNGEIRTFEIKSELDNFEKLEKQLFDYKRFSDRVSVVVSSKSAIRVERLLRSTKVGIVAFSGTGKLETIREAETENSFLDHEVLFKCLRKSEYLSIVSNLTGEVPAVPNTEIFQTCFRIAKQIDVEFFQVAVREILKKRQLKCPDMLLSRKTPTYLKHICYRLNPGQEEYTRLFEFLDSVY